MRRRRSMRRRSVGARRDRERSGTRWRQHSFINIKNMASAMASAMAALALRLSFSTLVVSRRHLGHPHIVETPHARRRCHSSDRNLETRRALGRRRREAIEARRRKVLVSVASLAHLLLLKVIGCMAAQSAKIIWHNMQESIQALLSAVLARSQDVSSRKVGEGFACKLLSR